MPSKNHTLKGIPKILQRLAVLQIVAETLAKNTRMSTPQKYEKISSPCRICVNYTMKVMMLLSYCPQHNAHIISRYSLSS